ncbi:16S rRNA (uracil(1498)-N(3))-methyltransferase [Inediibacterium massiliense]|uniref:16S rRNA (uracil(1498)-N(3))-methyltransferase n=1 Tax=Inediibacterium massiliense TaxID=1658111 RepID=UPI0006B66BBF|nr:16S rRNA (uracil(1498)-N(3))-methyltransferase [Inediibacterium massiliense]
MHRFFIDENNILENEKMILNDTEDVKHILKVLRLNEKDQIEVCDGKNNDYIGEIISLSPKEIELKIIEKRQSLTEANIEVTLFQGIPKGSKMELIIQKCTELGIFSIVPVLTNRTVVQLKDQKSEEKKVERWQKISNEAAKQCKRGMIPKIQNPILFEEVLKKLYEYDLCIVPYEKEEEMGLKEVFKKNKDVKKIAIFIGPEGGFEEEEIHKLKEESCISISLGKRILRTETAGFVTLSICMYELGDLGGR